MEFLREIKSHEKLREYLEFVHRCVHRELAVELTFLAGIAWTAHAHDR
jgi:heme A synthase